MDINRAREILQSSETINVTYQGAPVWIENINENDLTAVVKDLRRGSEEIVQVNSLAEG